ncbi:hypothetical protein [Micromonospora inositola]|uniref:Uncharacterized protein n=1 Tax=Micromonospora inositola TaxID=47865 RepID=A0A1C5JL16_9ACTN|nr:hypothetical protein [Micromonospora inositola]SCG70919.1 hypothetical protein GA0070613_4833 [Micromonospora inositola]
MGIRGASRLAAERDRLVGQAGQVEAASRAAAALRTELADLPGVWLAPELHVNGLTRFADIFLDNIFIDLAVRGRIRQARADRHARRARCLPPGGSQTSGVAARASRR